MQNFIFNSKIKIEYVLNNFFNLSYLIHHLADFFLEVQNSSNLVYFHYMFKPWLKVLAQIKIVLYALNYLNIAYCKVSKNHGIFRFIMYFHHNL